MCIVCLLQLGYVNLKRRHALYSHTPASERIIIRTKCSFRFVVIGVVYSAVSTQQGGGGGGGGWD